MRPQMLRETLRQFHVFKRPLCVEGQPGIGKTDIARDVARIDLDIPIVIKHMPTLLVEDLGILFEDKVDPDVMSYKLPHWFPRADKHGPDGILLFDDRNQVDYDIQKVVANIIRERELHGYQIPPGWSVWSTGNRVEDRAGSKKVLTQLRDRETMIPLETNKTDWIQWAVNHNIHPLVTAFINYAPHLLNTFNADKDISATPRSWEGGVSDLLHNTDLPVDILHECISGAVGPDVAATFMGFIANEENLPDIEMVYTNPMEAEVPTEQQLLFQTVSKLSYDMDEEKLPNILQYIERLPAQYNTLCISMSVHNEDKKDILTESAEFLEGWMVKYAHLMANEEAEEIVDLK